MDFEIHEPHNILTKNVDDAVEASQRSSLVFKSLIWATLAITFFAFDAYGRWRRGERIEDHCQVSEVQPKEAENSEFNVSPPPKPSHLLHRPEPL